MTARTKENKKILDFAFNLSEIAKKEKWVPRYDKESDAFYLTVRKLPKDARIKYFDDEVAFFVTKNNDIKGIFIEYFGSNFLKHHKEIKGVLKSVDKKKDSKKTIVELKKGMTKVIPKLEDIIQISLAENLKPAI